MNSILYIAFMLSLSLYVVFIYKDTVLIVKYETFGILAYDTFFWRRLHHDRKNGGVV